MPRWSIRFRRSKTRISFNNLFLLPDLTEKLNDRKNLSKCLSPCYSGQALRRPCAGLVPVGSLIFQVVGKAIGTLFDFFFMPEVAGTRTWVG